MERQSDILNGMGMPPAIGMRHATPQFGHVFSGGYYASAYYSYMWSEVMDADAFAAFEEKGDAFDPNLAKSLEANILSRGGLIFCRVAAWKILKRFILPTVAGFRKLRRF